MPRGFTEKEKEKITETLMSEGKRLFSQYGLKKTSVNELAKAAGIAPGSFYTFYQSKEALYFDIIEQEEEAIKNSFIQYEIPKEENTKQAIKDLLMQTFAMIEENALFSQLYLEQNHEALLRKLPDEKLQAHFDNDSETLALITSKWKEEGFLRNIDDDVLAGLFRGVFSMSLHKKEIGEKVYPQTLELLVELIVDGLVVEEGS
ncbi:TetR/AcrR family transcriptional regulator [Pontibacillus yanchengensis]|uniref:HTH tetR-type domain-containing protein n=1 Tax=Pontibacillus yanchengensis Y32 TaxID=1385514 RepID=A0A0A2TBI7_9BACI|nr:TetR/AcrR family transcriptional regulator [Pontibacillus yanchengensis]KGP72884.1 hypothetical protein N782_09880 [Pontibacillus yanchengensis Y32]